MQLLLEHFNFLLLCALVSSLFLFSCTNGIDEEVIEEEPLACFCVVPTIDGQFVEYTDAEITDRANTYSVLGQDYWLQASSEDNPFNRWFFLLFDVDFGNVDLLHILKPGEVQAQSFDSTIDDIVVNSPECNSSSAWGCRFSLSPSLPGNEIVITLVKDKVIEGEFSGKAFIVETLPMAYFDTTIYHTVTDGRFRLKYDYR